MRLDKAGEEGIATGIAIDGLHIQMRQNGAKALPGDVVLCSHELVAELDGLAEQLLIEVHHQQTLAGRIAGVEQTDIGLPVADTEVIAQHTVVEQQLNVVVFAVGIRVFVLDVHILT